MVFKLYFPYFREVDRFKSISPLKHQKQCLHFPAVIEVVIFHVCLGLEGSKHLNLKMVITIGFFFSNLKDVDGVDTISSLKHPEQLLIYSLYLRQCITLALCLS